jgi:hypothetical protein
VPPNPKNDDLFTRYLLGDELREQEELLVEDLLFRSNECLEHLNILEDELIEGHVRKQLPEKYETLLRTRLDLSPRLRERLRWVERHMASVSAPGDGIAPALPGGPQATVSWWEYAQRAWQRHRLTASVASVGLSALCAAGIWILNERSDNRELRRSLVQQRQVDRDLASRLEDERAKHESLNRELAQIQSGSTLGATSLILTPADEIQAGQRRGTSQPAIDLAPQAGVLQLRMAPRALKYARYRGVIATVEGEEIISQRDLTVMDASGKHYVEWDLATKGLPSNDYVISLYGIALNGSHSLVEEFSFRLRKAGQ